MGFVVWWRHASWWTRVNIWEGDGLVTRKPRLKLVFLSLSLSKALYSAIWKAIWSIMHVIEPRRRRSSSMLILVICLSVVLFDGAGTLPRCLGSNRKVIWFLLFDACDWLFNLFWSKFLVFIFVCSVRFGEGALLHSDEAVSRWRQSSFTVALLDQR